MKIKKQEAKQNAKLEDKQLDQVQGGSMTQLITGSIMKAGVEDMDVLHR